MDEMVTIRPRVWCATMLRAAAWQDRNAPRRFVSMTACHADTSMLRTEAFVTMPAFAIMTAGGPNTCCAEATRFATAEHRARRRERTPAAPDWRTFPGPGP